MKVRKGFVSNSSSSSYIEKIAIEPKAFYRSLSAEYGWSIFQKSKVLEDIKKQISDRASYNKSIILDEYETGLFLRKKELENLDYKDPKIVKIALENNRITVREGEKEITLEYATSMHNDFNEGVDDILKEIILFFLMDTNHKVEAERIPKN